MKNLLKILIALMLGTAVIFTAVSCSEDTSNTKVEDEDEDDEDKKNDEDEEVKDDEEGKEDKKDKEEKSDEEIAEEEATEALENFLEAQYDGNYKKAIGYCTNVDEDVAEVFKGIKNSEDAVDMVLEMSNVTVDYLDLYGSEEKVVETLRDALLKGFEINSYEIVDCEVVDEEEVTFEVDETSYGELEDALEEWKTIYEETSDDVVDSYGEYTQEDLPALFEDIADEFDKTFPGLPCWLRQ